MCVTSDLQATTISQYTDILRDNYFCARSKALKIYTHKYSANRTMFYLKIMIPNTKLICQ